MLTADEILRRHAMVELGLEHYGVCACGVGRSTEARLYRCTKCDVKSCYTCMKKHRCEVANG